MSVVQTGQEALNSLRNLPARREEQPASCVILRNPFDPFEKEVHAVDSLVTVDRLAAIHGIDPHKRIVTARINGSWLLQRKWGRRLVVPGDVVEFQLHVGSGDFLKTALMVALVVAASFVVGPFGGAALAGALGGTAAVWGAVASFAFIAGGSYLINALIPPKSVSAALSSGGLASPSSTYTLELQNNQARPGQVIPVVYGHHRVWCDYAATPYLIVDGDQLYFRGLYVVGHGEYDITYLRIGDTFLDAFPGAYYAVYAPGATVTIFDQNIYSAQEVSGQTLLAPNEASSGYIGGFPTLPPGKVGATCSIIFSWPSGLYGINPTTGAYTYDAVTIAIEFREINDLGAPLTSWLLAENFVRTENRSQAMYSQRNYVFGNNARRECRVIRTNNKATTAGSAQTVWQSLASSIANAPTSYPGLTTIAVQLQYSNTLTPTTSRIFNAEVTRKLPIWNGYTWSAPTATRSIAWAAADILKATYGGDNPDSRINLEDLLALDAIWTARGDTFNAIFDSPTTVEDALHQVLRAGRSKQYMQAGQVRFYRHHLSTLPVAVYGVNNIKLDSLQLQFELSISGQTADGIEAEYFDETLWRPQTITRGVDGAQPVDPASDKLFGVTVRSQAIREAEYMVAANRYGRVFVSFSVPAGGLLSSPGDAALLAHDVPEWGVSGDVKSYDTASHVMVVEATLVMDPAYTWTIILSDQQSRPSKQIVVVPGVYGDRFVLDEAPTYDDASPFTVVVTPDRSGTGFMLGRSSNAPQRVSIVSIQPRGNNEVSISAVIEDDRIHVN